MILDKFRKSKFGWILAISAFSVWFFIVVSFATGIISLPITFLSEDEDLFEAVISIILPIVMFGGSVLMYRTFFSEQKKQLKLKASLKTLLKGLGFKKPNKNAVWLTPLILVGYVFLLLASILILQAISPNFAEQEQEVAQVVGALNGWYLALMVLGVGVLTPIAEETFFRGLLIPLYGKRLKIAGAIIVPALLFGLAHMQVNVGIDTFIFGIALGYLTWKTESIYPAIGLHVLKNCLALSVILNS